MPPRSPDRAEARALLFFFALGALAALATLVWLLAIPADPKNSVLFGFSAARLVLLGVLLAGLIGFTGAAVFLSRRGRAARYARHIFGVPRTRGLLFAGCFVLLLAAWVLMLMPPARLGLTEATVTRLFPLLAWLGAVGLLGCFWLLAATVRRAHPSALQAVFGSPRRVLGISMGIFALFLSLWLLAAHTGLGLTPASGFWNKAGTPILGLQIALAGAAGAALLLLERWRSLRSLRAAWPDALLCVLLWAAAFFAWQRLPAMVSHFTTGVYPPNFASYPLSDAALYDLSAQSILSGNDITMVDKPLHSAYLALLHLLTGSHYARTLDLQTAVLALIPVLLYLLGRALHSRPAGVIAAALSIFKEANAVQLTDLIQVSTVKMLMTEMLTMLAVLVFTWLLVRGLQEQPRSFTRLLLAGGALGLAMLVRLNAAFILPFALLAVWISLPGGVARRALLVTLVAAIAVAAQLPWMARNAEKYGNPLRAITGKTQGVIVDKRYNPLLENQPPADVEEEDAQSAPQPAPPAEPPAGGLAKYARLAGPILAHYAHNLIGVTVMIAPLVRHETLLDAVRAPYWDLVWDGRFTPGGQLLLALTLAVIALGLAAAWMRWRAAGLVPLFSLLGYTVTSALSLTSGGRYLTPVDWVVVFYFALGLADLTAMVAALLGLDVRLAIRSPESAAVQWNPRALWRSAGLALAVTLAIGALPALFERVYPNYQPPAALREQLHSGAALPADLRAFLSQPGAEIVAGRAFYARFYATGQGDTAVSSALHGVKDFPRLALYLFDGRKSARVLLPLGQAPAHLPDSSEAAALGCRRGSEFRAVALLLADGTLLPADPPNLGCPAE